jgi:cytochrome c553
MRRALRFVAIGTLAVVVLIAALAGGFYLWAVGKRDARLAATYDIARHEFPIPFPLTEAEKDALRNEMRLAAQAADPASDPVPGGAKADPLAGADLDQRALDAAVTRGKHLVEARYACGFCHGSDFGGGVMIEDALIGTVKAPNLTAGEGSVIATYTAGDWDRKVRHGVNPAGHPGFMPSIDYFAMSDRELSDIVAYLRSLPPIDRTVPPVVFGPLGTILVATGEYRMSADIHPDHSAPHVVEPPPEGPTPEFGSHIAGVCTGCHRTDFSGGPIKGGPPDWPPAANLTPHEQGLASWTYDDFVRLMRTGIRPDGTPTRVPMAEAIPLGNAMTEVELQALWAHFQSLPPLTDGT